MGFVNTMKELLTKIQIFNKSDGKEPKDSVPEASLGPVFFLVNYHRRLETRRIHFCFLPENCTF